VLSEVAKRQLILKLTMIGAFVYLSVTENKEHKLSQIRDNCLKISHMIEGKEAINDA
jgi:hypothetical protein